MILYEMYKVTRQLVSYMYIYGYEITYSMSALQHVLISRIHGMNECS